MDITPWNGTTMRSFVEDVQGATNLDSADEAERLTRATLGTLAEGISGGQVDDLMPELPEELRRELSGRSGQARSLDKTGFLDRVSGEITTTDMETTEDLVRGVLRTLRSWAPEGQIDDTVDQLPRSISEMFG
jgi:uncharacterized protein (DUF2267 family)